MEFGTKLRRIGFKKKSFTPKLGFFLLIEQCVTEGTKGLLWHRPISSNLQNKLFVLPPFRSKVCVSPFFCKGGSTLFRDHRVSIFSKRAKVQTPKKMKTGSEFTTNRVWSQTKFYPHFFSRIMSMHPWQIPCLFSCSLWHVTSDMWHGFLFAVIYALH